MPDLHPVGFGSVARASMLTLSMSDLKPGTSRAGPSVKRTLRATSGSLSQPCCCECSRHSQGLSSVLSWPSAQSPLDHPPTRTPARTLFRAVLGSDTRLVNTVPPRADDAKVKEMPFEILCQDVCRPGQEQCEPGIEQAFWKEKERDANEQSWSLHVSRV